MNFNHPSIGWVFAFAVLLFLYINEKFCTKHESSGRDTTIVQHYDTTIYKNTITEWKPNVIINNPAAIPKVIDTSQVIRDYFAKKGYDTTLVDSNLSEKVHIDLERNNITTYSREYKLLKPQTTFITNPVRPPTIGVLVGASAYVVKDGKSTLFIDAAIRNKKENIIEFGYDPFYKGVKVGGLFLIKLRKDH